MESHMEFTKAEKLNNDPWNRQKRDDNQPPDIDAIIKNLFKQFNDSGSSQGFFLVGLLSALLLIWGLAGIFVVSEGETAIVLRFGQFNRELGRGLKWYAPFIESKFIINTEKISTYEYDAEMLTTDENYANVKVAVMYRINDAKDYKFNVENPIDTLKEVTASALRQVVGQSQLEDVLSSGKERIRAEIEDTIVSTLKDYDIGIQIRAVKLLAALPPKQVSAAFEDAIKAREDEQRFINIAEAYHNEIIPNAKGKASRILNEALATKEATILRAQAEVKGFDALVETYKKSPSLLSERLYIQTMENVLSKTPKVLISSEQNIAYLPLQEMFNKLKGSE